MIDYLSGCIKKKFTNSLVLDVNSVGYGVELPLSVMADLPKEGASCQLWIYTKVKEDSIKLYGFATLAEKDAFVLLLNVNGVGPKVALAILSCLSVYALRTCVEKNQPEILEHVPGIGHRTAEKILLELKGKLDKFPTLVEPSDKRVMLGGELSLDHSKMLISEGSISEVELWDLKSALLNLGYKDKDISYVVQRALKEYKGDQFSDLVKFALRIINDRATSPHSVSASVLEQLF
jgi:Holliday junction DNA helicase RuvA